MEDIWSAPLAPTLLQGREKIGCEHSERHGYFKPRSSPYMALFKAEKGDIGPENTYFWDINTG